MVAGDRLRLKVISRQQGSICLEKMVALEDRLCAIMPHGQGRCYHIGDLGGCLGHKSWRNTIQPTYLPTGWTSSLCKGLPCLKLTLPPPYELQGQRGCQRGGDETLPPLLPPLLHQQKNKVLFSSCSLQKATIEQSLLSASLLVHPTEKRLRKCQKQDFSWWLLLARRSHWAGW